MKSAIKMTAFALLISSLSACKLTESGNNAAAQSLNSATPSSESISPTPNSPVVPEKTAVAEKLDKNGEEWRSTYLLRGYDGKGKTTSYWNNGWFSVKENGNTTLAKTYFNLDSENLSQGINSGSVEYKDVKFITFTPGEGGLSDELTNKLDYIVANQPYSSYGTLFLSKGNSMLFTLGQNALLEGQDNAEYIVGKQNGSEVIWNDAVVGDATYKGNIIARVTRNDENDKMIAELPRQDGTVMLNAHFENGSEKSYVTTTVDSHTLGKFQLGTVKFDSMLNLFETVRDVEKLQVRKETGHYSANTPIAANTEHSTGSFSGYDVIKTKGDGLAAVYYRGQFVGKDFNDVVGDMNIHNDTLHYEAVYGGTKQAK